MKLKKRLLKFWNFWPPFLFSGIKIEKNSSDYREIRVRLKLRFWNCNYVGTQYGGLLFSMTDPFYMIMLIQNLGEDHIVWDKETRIRYLKPGRTDVTAEFKITEEDLNAIRLEVQEHGTMHWLRKVEIKDANGEVIADVEKTIYIRKKR